MPVKGSAHPRCLEQPRALLRRGCHLVRVTVLGLGFWFGLRLGLGLGLGLGS